MCLDVFGYVWENSGLDSGHTRTTLKWRTSTTNVGGTSSPMCPNSHANSRIWIEKNSWRVERPCQNSYDGL